MIARSARRRQARPRRGGHAVRRLPPARAGGAPGDDADPGGGHRRRLRDTSRPALRRCVDSGHTRLVVTEDDNTDRMRGIVHANSLARRLMTEGPTASIDGSVKDALIVPETKPLDDLLADLQRERASMAVVIDEYGRTAGIVTDRGHHRGGRRRDRRRDRPGGRRASGGWPTATGACAATCRSPTSPTTASSCRSTPTPTTRSAASSSASSGRLPKRGDMVQRQRLLDARRVGAREPHRGGRRATTPSARRSATRSVRSEVQPPEVRIGGGRGMWCVKLSDSQRDA